MYLFYYVTYSSIEGMLWVTDLVSINQRSVAQLCSTLCDPTDCSPPGSPVHGLLQARMLEWVAISFFKGYSWPRDRTHVSCTSGRFFTVCATRETFPKLWVIMLVEAVQARKYIWSSHCCSLQGRSKSLSHDFLPRNYLVFLWSGSTSIFAASMLVVLKWQ